MTKYSILPAYLHPFADSAEFIIKQRYNLGKAQIEQPIDKNIGFRPTLHWKTKTEIIACEVSDSPFPVVFNEVLTSVLSVNIPVRIISAFPIEHGLSATEYQHKTNKAKGLGVGLLPVSPGNLGAIDYSGICVTTLTPIPEGANFKKPLRRDIRNAHELYMKDPNHGVQELGQLVEKILIQLAVQAKKTGALVSGGFKSPEKFYAQNKLIDDLIKDKVIDNKILKRCGTFADDRNSVSHKPKTWKEAVKLQARIKDLFNGGLYILQELPDEIIAKGYKFKM